jgi:hypothetical protein
VTRSVKTGPHAATAIPVAMAAATRPARVAAMVAPITALRSAGAVRYWRAAPARMKIPALAPSRKRIALRTSGQVEETDKPTYPSTSRRTRPPTKLPQPSLVSRGTTRQLPAPPPTAPARATPIMISAMCVLMRR